MEASPPKSPPTLSFDAGNLRRRRRVNRLMELSAWLAAVIAVGVLAFVLISVFIKGVDALNIDFLTKAAAPFGEPGGGIAPAIIGSAVIVAIATLIAVPVGILVALYATEFASPRSGFAVRYVLDILNGVPTIITGIFIFGLLVAGHQGKGIYGSIALAIVMLPLVARSAGEVLSLVPPSVKEAGLALGASRWRTVVSVLVPTALSGMLTAALIAVARAAGETAPLLFVVGIPTNQVSFDPSQALNTLPLTIFTKSQSPNPADHTQAWGAALLLIFLVLVVSIIARVLSARSRKRLGSAR
ncbi:MAG: phosphate ABC transporter permease PstA [Solirubrobacterales bacterium]